MLHPIGGFEGGTVRLEVGDSPALGGVSLAISVEQLVGDGQVSFTLVRHEGTRRLEAHVTGDAGPPSMLVDEMDWLPTSQQWLQLREESGTLYFEASDDGVTFSTLFETGTPIDLTEVRVGVVANNSLLVADDTQVSVKSFELRCE